MRSSPFTWLASCTSKVRDRLTAPTFVRSKCCQVHFTFVLLMVSGGGWDLPSPSPPSAISGDGRGEAARLLLPPPASDMRSGADDSPRDRNGET